MSGNNRQLIPCGLNPQGEVEAGSIVPAANSLSNRASAGAIYNPRQPPMLLRAAGFRRAWFVLVVFSAVARAGDWRDLELELARKISSATGPGVVWLDVTNRSSLRSADVEEIRRGLTELLATSGVRVWQKEESSSEVALTLSESLDEYVWVAEIRQPVGERRILMASAPRPRPSAMAEATPIMLHATHLVSRPEAIVDAAFVSQSPAMLAVLTESQVTLYQSKEGRWIEASSLAIHRTRPFPRDLRGRIILRRDRLFDAYLPGLICRASASPPLALDCRASDDPWPLEAGDGGLSAFFAPTRNFFTGALVPGIGHERSAPAFYTAAVIPRERYRLWLFAGCDGQLHLMDGMTHQVAAGVHWGADIAGVHAVCRARSQVLATLATVDLADSVQAFEFPDREPVAVSQKLDFDGQVSGLWTEASGDSAMAVVHRANGDYEAVLINLDCSR